MLCAFLYGHHHHVLASTPHVCTVGRLSYRTATSHPEHAANNTRTANMHAQAPSSRSGEHLQAKCQKNKVQNYGYGTLTKVIGSKKKTPLSNS